MRSRQQKMLLGLSGLVAAAVAGDFRFPDAWTSEQIPLKSENCTISHMSRYDEARRGAPIFLSTNPLDHFEKPSVEPLNTTTGEQWEFDGISEDGRQAFMFGFYRDTSFAFMGTGNLRFYFEYAFPNGTRHAVVHYAESSTIETCAGRGTRGVWRGHDWTYSFEVSDDMSQARISMDGPEEKVAISMNSLAPPRYANNEIWPSSNGDTEPVPFFHWVEPVPVADARIDAVVAGETVSWIGMGGHERLWGAYSWYTCVASMTAVRLHTGPYALSLVEFGSNREHDTVIPSVIMAEDGKAIFSTRRAAPHENEDWMQVRKLYGGDGITTEQLADKATGFRLTLHSPAGGKTWEFEVKHLNIGFEYPFGEGVGSTGYSGLAEGGLVGAETHHGPAYTEIMKFPKKSWLLAKSPIR